MLTVCVRAYLEEIAGSWRMIGGGVQGGGKFCSDSEKRRQHSRRSDREENALRIELWCSGGLTEQDVQVDLVFLLSEEYHNGIRSLRIIFFSHRRRLFWHIFLSGEKERCLLPPFSSPVFSVCKNKCVSGGLLFILLFFLRVTLSFSLLPIWSDMHETRGESWLCPSQKNKTKQNKTKKTKTKTKKHQLLTSSDLAA